MQLKKDIILFYIGINAVIFLVVQIPKRPNKHIQKLIANIEEIKINLKIKTFPNNLNCKHFVVCGGDDK